jgi:glutathione S-transferase
METLQNLLPGEGYAVVEWSIADAAVTPFLARASVALKNDLGAFDEGKGIKVWETLQNDAKYARFGKYFEDVTKRDSFKETFFEVRGSCPADRTLLVDWFTLQDVIVETCKKRFSQLRAERVAASS